jgi:branched-chain amino acid transport system ATP-binding protein
MLEARDLHTFFDSSHVLHGVDFSVGDAETVALMGRNGVGKTTLIRSMLGHVRSRKGSVRIDRARAVSHRAARRRLRS